MTDLALDLDGRMAPKPIEQAYVTVWHDKFARSATDSNEGGVGDRVGLTDCFTRLYDTDAHFTAYESLENKRFSSKSSLFDKGVKINVLAVDVDAPGHEASPKWRDRMREICAKLPGTPYGYFTRGGMRLIWLCKPHAIESTEDGTEWSRKYLRCLVELFGLTRCLIADPSCKDWTRFFRVPHGVRDGVEQIYGPLCGRVDCIGEWVAPGDDAQFSDDLAAIEASGEAWSNAAKLLKNRVVKNKEAPSYDFAPSTNGALTSAYQAVATSTNGARNAALFAQSMFLKKLVDKNELTEKQAKDALFSAAIESGLNAVEAKRTIISAFSQ